MKKIFLAAAFLVFTTSLYSQFTFVRTDPAIVYGHPDSVIKSHGMVNNTTSGVIPIQISITNRYVTPGWDSIGMCTWQLCYGAGTYSVTENCAPGQHEFYVYFYPYGLQGEGRCRVTMTYQTTSISQDFIVTSSPIGIKQISSIVKNFSLGQNYPNPFNPSTKINFAIPKSDHVSLRVYDLLGREVKVLVNESLTPGEYEIDFDGKGLSSGMYYYSLRAGEYVDVKKMVLVK